MKFDIIMKKGAIVNLARLAELSGLIERLTNWCGCFCRTNYRRSMRKNMIYPPTDALSIFMSVGDFLELDRKTDSLSFAANAYETFHLTGDPGILDEVDDYLRRRIEHGDKS
jgi:hypothetical protein